MNEQEIISKERIITSDNIVSATVVLEFDNGEYAITGTTNRSVILTCCEFLTFKKLPEKYFRNLSLTELDLEDKNERTTN